VKRDVQFVRALDAPYEAVRDALRDHPQRMLGGRPVGEGRVTTRVTAAVGNAEVSGEANIDIVGFDEPQGIAAGSYLLFRGDATRRPDLFPHLEARLDVVPIDEERTALFLVATYKPPLGVVGGTADALGLYHLADDALNRLFAQVCERVAAEASGAAGPAGGV